MAGLFSGQSRPQQSGVGLLERIALMGQAGMGGPTPQAAIRAREAEILAARQAREQTAYQDRIRSMLSPADVAGQASGTGAAPSLEQQESILADAQLVNPTAAGLFAPAVARRRLDSLTGGLPVEQRLATILNPEKAGEAFATQFRDDTLAPGSIRTRGSQTVAAAPTTTRFDDRYGTYDPVTGQTTYSQPRAATYAEETQRNDPVNLAPGGRAINPVTGATIASAPDAYSLSPGEQRYQAGSLEAQNTAPRPLPDAIRKDNEQDEAQIAEREGVVARLDNALGLIQNGMINLDPASRASAWFRNNTGNSSPQSQAQAELRRTVESLRNSILNDATGPQTDGDSLRALNQIIQGWGDEQVVMQGIQAYRDIQDRKTQTQRSIMEQRVSQYGGAPTAGAQQPAPAANGQISREAAIAELRRRGRL